jgi:hypothetical protein
MDLQEAGVEDHIDRALSPMSPLAVEADRVAKFR